MTDEVDRLMAGIAERKVRDLARAITLSKRGTGRSRTPSRLADQVRGGADRSRSHVVGITGSRGGQSTMTAALITAFRARGQSVVAVAVDPSSPFSGGALLGDRIRMQSHSSDENVFIRSMASRGRRGRTRPASSTPPDSTLSWWRRCGPIGSQRLQQRTQPLSCWRREWAMEFRQRKRESWKSVTCSW